MLRINKGQKRKKEKAVLFKGKHQTQQKKSTTETKCRLEGKDQYKSRSHSKVRKYRKR